MKIPKNWIRNRETQETNTNPMLVVLVICKNYDACRIWLSNNVCGGRIASLGQNSVDTKGIRYQTWYPDKGISCIRGYTLDSVIRVGNVQLEKETATLIESLSR